MRSRSRVSTIAVGLAILGSVLACSRGSDPDSPGAAVSGGRLGPSVLLEVEPLHAFDGILLSGQPGREEFAKAAKRGVKTVINLRHAAEITEYDEREVVEAEGLIYVNLPFRDPSELTDEVFDRAREYLKTAERPILLHCSSANRVGAVWLPYRVLDGGLTYVDALVEAQTVGLKSADFETRAREYIERH